MAATQTVLHSPRHCNFSSQVTQRHGVVTLFGYGIRAQVERGHLILEDGIGRERRSGRFARVYHGLKRLVVIGSDGCVSLAALRWLANQGASFVMLERDGSVLATTGPVRSSDARLRRAQALAENNYVGLRLAIELIREKLKGQELIAREKLSNSRIADEIALLSVQLESAKTVASILSIEAVAALAYWSGWANLKIEFSKIDLRKLPDHWRLFGTRVSPITGSPRLAVNPPNAVLNYLYAMLEAEARLAAAELGLDPGLGVLHKDRPNRDSLACDLMEPVRPLVDAYLFDWLSRGPLRREWFFEQGNGNCRLMGEFAARLSETAPLWRKAIGPIAEKAANTFWKSRVKLTAVRQVATRLTQTSRSKGRDAYRKATPSQASPEPMPDNRCSICGERIRKGARCCAGCAPLLSRANLLQTAKRGRLASHNPISEARRSATRMKRVEAQKQWNPSDLPKWLDEDYYRRKILPALARLTITKIQMAMDVSFPYAAMVRKGIRIPHPRHWMRLAGLAGVSSELLSAEN